MAEETKIQWTHSTFNPWRGCVKVSTGCKFCYAERQSVRNPNVLGVWGAQGSRPLASEAYWRQPLAWERKAARDGVRHRVFCCSFADVFEDWPGQMTDGNACPLWYVSPITPPIADHGPPPPAAGITDCRPYTLDDARARLFRLTKATPHLDWQFLTKRPQNMARMAPASWRERWPANAWAMASVEDQPNANRRLPEILKVPAAVRGLSVEPLLGPVDLSPWLERCECGAGFINGAEGHTPGCATYTPGISWVIIGGESGPGARPCHVEWVRDLVRQCRDAGVAVFVKQLGARPVERTATGGAAFEVGGPRGSLKASVEAITTVREGHLRDPKGGDMEEWPADLRIREFPNATGGPL